MSRQVGEHAALALDQNDRPHIGYHRYITTTNGELIHAFRYCEDVTCTDPPDDECLNPDTLRRYLLPGRCVNRECLYSRENVTCALGCQAGACVDDPCAGLTCDTPPSDVCLNPTTLRAYTAQGTCVDGKCSYPHQDLTCGLRCQQAVCIEDPCEQVDCSTSPDACHGSPGTCVDGLCQYPVVAACGDQDGCCLAGCGPNSDADCPVCHPGFYPCPDGCCPWTIEVVDDQDAAGQNISIALDQSQSPRFIYRTGGSKRPLRYAQKIGDDWRAEPIYTSGDVVGTVSLVLKDADTPHISLPDYYKGNVLYLKKDGPVFTIREVEQPTQHFEEYSSMALDTAGHPHVAYFVYSTRDLKYAAWTGSEWEIHEVDSTGLVGRYPSLALDDDDHPHISYNGPDYEQLRYAHHDGVEWSIETVDDHGDCYGGGGSTSLVLDTADLAHIAYYDCRSKDLKYARWTGDAWSIYPVDSDTNVGNQSSLALSGDDHPHISYYDLANKNLKYAFFTSQAWEILTVEADAEAGEYSALALDQHDRPHIGYHQEIDPNGGALRYARW